MNILVTGSAGHLGEALVRTLRSGGSGSARSVFGPRYQMSFVPSWICRELVTVGG